MYGSWTNWVYWQYREGPDVNLFNGTDDEFWQMVNRTPADDSLYVKNVIVALSDGRMILQVTENAPEMEVKEVVKTSVIYTDVNGVEHTQEFR